MVKVDQNIKTSKVNKTPPAARSSEEDFCRFHPFMDQGSSPIRMWYHNCDDEGSLDFFTDFETATEDKKVVGKLKEGHDSGAYIVSTKLRHYYIITYLILTKI